MGNDLTGYTDKTLGELRRKNEAAEVAKNRAVLDEFFCKSFLPEINQLIDILDSHYFRSEFVNFDSFPARLSSGVPLILISNHSGMAFPWDGMIFCARLLKREHYGSNAVRPLVASALTRTLLMNPFMIPNIWKKVGALEATTLNFDTLMCQKDYNVLIYPEGISGIGKGFNKRYRLQSFSTSYLRMSLKYKTDILPFYTINGEFINPYSYKSNWVNRLISKIGIPFLPLAIHTILVLIQPWLFYYALPAKLTYVLGERIKPYELLNKPFEKVTIKELRNLNRKIHQKMQLEIKKASEKYGKYPYNWKDFFQNFRQKMKLFPLFLPPGWPLLFAEFERQKMKNKANTKPFKVNFKSTLGILIRNPITLCYFIPLVGWIPLLIRGYSKKLLQTANRGKFNL